MTRSLMAGFAVSALLSACVTTTSEPEISDDEAAVANMNLGIGYLRQGRPDAAVDALERAVDLNPRLATAHSALALAYDQLDEPDQAEDHHRRATEIDPGDADVQNSYAVFLCRQNRWSDAERYFKRAVADERYALRATAYVNAGNCARGANELAKAEESYRAALEIDSANTDAMAGMVEIAVHNENYLQARAFIQRLFVTAPPTPYHLLVCYGVEQRLGDMAAAESCARQLRTNFPNSTEAIRLRELERNAAQ
ncbi:MAG TPA: type IV pilus biogenesis/stability protein PilW [Gammaproteobacteria bacterium]